ncbi:MAG: hypothetical protein U0637_10960 [Phycisphaerales bacterium]
MSQSSSPFSQQPPPAGPGPVFAPPTEPGRVQLNTMWPQVVGIVSIVFGGFGVLGNCWQMVSTLFMPRFLGMIPRAGAQASQSSGGSGTTTTVTVDPVQTMQATIGKWGPWLATGAGLQLVAAGVLLFAGVLVLRRRRSGAGLHLGYAGVRALSVVVYSVINYLYMQDIMAGVTAQSSAGGGPPAAMMSGMMSFFGVVGVFFGLAWGLAYPVFVLIWFNRGAVRRETAAWK